MPRDGLWYPVTPASPPDRTRVRLSWSGRSLIGWRTVHPKTRERVWAIPAGGGDLVYWPPEDTRISLAPSAWRPEDATAWPYALPDPLPAPAPRAARDDPQPSAEEQTAEEAANDNGHWWRDAALVRREPAGRVLRAMAEARVMRAILCDGMRAWHPDPPRGGWPVEIEEASRAVAFESDAATRSYGTRFEPRPADWDDYLVAMGWLCAINPPELWARARTPFALSIEQRVLVARAIDPPFSWRQIGERESKSAEGARQIYARALDRVRDAANGRRLFHHMTQADQMAALRERNRTARRQR